MTSLARTARIESAIPLPSIASADSAGRGGAAGPVVSGYRLAELIGIGESANVYAGRLVTGALDGRMRGGAEGADSDPVAVKVCLPSAEGAGRAAECRVLALRPIAAMPRLLDLATTRTGELVLVMSLCRGRPWGSALPGAAERATPAETLSRLIEELHDAGVAHGGLDPGAVLVDDDGAVALVGFRAAQFAGSAGFDAAIGSDLRAVAALTRRASLAVAFPRTVDAAAPERLAGWRPTATDDIGDEAWQWRDDEGGEPTHADLPFLETLEPAMLAIRESGAAFRALMRHRSGGATPRRRKVLTAGGALVVAAAVTGCLLIPSGSSTPVQAGEAIATDRAAAVTSSPSPSPSRSPAAAVDATGASPVDPDAVQAATRSEDPVQAAIALLELRAECLRGHDPTCLDEVDQWDAPALLADRELARGSPRPHDPLASVTGVTLVERIGATALLEATADGEGTPETTKPVSLLLMRGETGWRLRSYQVGRGPD